MYVDASRRLGGVLDREARRWLIDRRLAALIFLAPIAGVAAMALLAVVSRRGFLFLVTEDRPLEWSQFVFWAGASLFAALVTWRLARNRRWWHAAAYAVLALGCFAAAGEEISWAQRVLGLETPEPLRESNEQKEITLHNLASVNVAFRIVMVFAGLYGSLLAWLLRATVSDRREELLDLYVPPLFLTSSFAVLAVYRLARFAFFTDPGPMISGFGEWPETSLALGLMLFAALNWHRLSPVPPATEDVMPVRSGNATA